jgi:N-acetyl-anhydromuramyl-L-alanine amidase AmpD
MKQLCAFLCVVGLIAGCKSNKTTVGQRLERKGDEIVVAGQYFHTGTPVVLWTDPGGYDAYRTERRFSPLERASFEWSKVDNPDLSANRLGLRTSVLSDGELDKVRGGGWPLELVQDRVDQFVMHYDVCGISRTCFKVLHDSRNLSVQFMLDIDGTIYQTMDLKERAWHASKANSRSVGIEIANMGTSDLATLKQWYEKQPDGRMKITIPARLGDGGVRVPGDYYAARNDLIRGVVNGKEYAMYDLTPQQYDALTRLVATVCTALPKVTLDYPKDDQGKLIASELPEEMYANYTGLLGHYNVTRQKQDPGPAFQWDRIVNGAKLLMSKEALKRNAAMKGQAVQIRTNRLTDAPRGPELVPATQPATDKARRAPASTTAPELITTAPSTQPVK